MKDRLVKISPEKLKSLIKLYKNVNSTTYLTYLTIKNYLDWVEQDPNIKHIEFLSLNGDISDGTFVIIDRYNAYPDTLNADQSKLLCLLKLLEFSKGFTFCGTRCEVQPTIMKTIEQIGTEIEFNCIFPFYRCSKEKALKFDIELPNGIHLKPLKNRSDVEKVNSLWKYRDSNSLKLLERLAKYNFSVGAFTDDGTMVSWALRDQSGMIAALQTDEKYFGFGYAKLVTKCLAKMIAESGDDVYATIHKENIASQRLFTGLGFEPAGDLVWTVTKYDWDDE